MKTVRIAEPKDYPVLYNLLFDHRKIGKEPENENLSLNEFQNKLKNNIIIFLCEENSIINSYMITFKLFEFPIWIMRLIVTRPITSFYNPETTGIANLYDHAIEYWESHGLTTFTYVQPKTYIKSANHRLRKVSKKLQTYTSFTLYQYNANQVIDHPLSKKIAGRDVFTNDVVIRIHYKNAVS